MDRIGVVGIIVKNNKEVSLEIQQLLSDYSEIILGRMGLPCPELGLSAISLIVQGTNEKISALSGKIGKVAGVSVKSALVNSLEI